MLHTALQCRPPGYGPGEHPRATETAEARQWASAYHCLPCGSSATVANDHVFVLHSASCWRRRITDLFRPTEAP